MKLCALAVSLMTTIPLHAQPLTRFQEALVNADNELKAGRFEEADRRLRKMSGAIAERFGSGSQAMYTVAVIASFRSIAAAGLNKMADAEWYWDVATSFYPKFAGSDLHVYGSAGEAVMRVEASHPCEHLESQAGATPPKPIRNPMPKYPYHAIETGIAETITIDVTITETGLTRCPRIVETHYDPSLA